MASESVALVTGSSRGIGRGIATALAERGWHLVINYRRDKTAAEATKVEVEALGTSAHIVQADMAILHDLERLVSVALKQYGKIDLLVNNAGIGPQKRVDMLQVGEESYDEVMAVNLKGPFFLIIGMGMTSIHLPLVAIQMTR